MESTFNNIKPSIALLDKRELISKPLTNKDIIIKALMLQIAMIFL